jgi:hypothetical protein
MLQGHIGHYAQRAGLGGAGHGRLGKLGANAPDLSDNKSSADNQQQPGGQLPLPASPWSSLRKAVRLAEKKLSNLTLAINEMALLAVLSAIGTVIDQNQVM